MINVSSFKPSAPLEFVEPQSSLSHELYQLSREDLDLGRASARTAATKAESVCWGHLRDAGTALWLDTGDIEAIDPLWNEHFSGLTTNNTLLNNEVQKGTYDALIPQTADLLSDMDVDQRTREVAFVLNARHALRLVERFGCAVSVELHTDVAHDCQASIAYGRRYHEICPERFVVKVPFTPAGIIAAKVLRGDGIEVNMTLGFSARQNYLATVLSNPSFVNVFLGRLNAYIADNALGDGDLVGEKATLASQDEVRAFALGLPQSKTRQIAASLRDGKQVARLAGVDVMTMPPPVASEAAERYATEWPAPLDDDCEVSLASGVSPETVRWEKLWTVTADERKFAEQMILHAPQSAEDVTNAARDHGIGDLFPQLSDEEAAALADDGKIPQHQRWAERIMRDEVAIDSLMTLAGLAHFAAAQEQLDARIRNHMP